MTADLETRLGDPYDPANPLGTRRVLDADEGHAVSAEMESLLESIGFGAEYVPAALGGRFTTVARLIDSMRPVFARDSALGLGYGLTTFMAGLNVCSAGDAAQRREFADTVLAGGRVSVAYHEFAHGNDFTGNECRAVADGEGYRLQGRKELINNADRADLAVVFARTGEGSGPRDHSLFLVRPHADGVRVLPRYQTLGLRGCRLSGFEFDGLAVPAEDRIGEPGRAAEIALRSFQVSRCVAAGTALGPVEESLFLVLRFALNRSLYSRTVSDLPHAQAVLADAFTDLLLADVMVAATARDLHTDPDGAGPRCAAVKYLVPRVLEDAMASLSVVLGARFYLRNGDWAPFGKHYRDLPALAIGHAGGVSCQLAILPQLRRLTRLDRADLSDVVDETGEELPPLELDALTLRARRGDRSLATLSGELDRTPGAPGTAPIREALDELCRSAARLEPADSGVTAPAPALRLTEDYCLLVAASAVLGHERRSGDSPWTRRARERLAYRLGRGPATTSPDLTRDVFTELHDRARAGRGFDPGGRPVARRLD